MQEKIIKSIKLSVSKHIDRWYDVCIMYVIFIDTPWNIIEGCQVTIRDYNISFKAHN